MFSGRPQSLSPAAAAPCFPASEPPATPLILSSQGTPKCLPELFPTHWLWPRKAKSGCFSFPFLRALLIELSLLLSPSSVVVVVVSGLSRRQIQIVDSRSQSPRYAYCNPRSIEIHSFRYVSSCRLTRCSKDLLGLRQFSTHLDLEHLCTTSTSHPTDQS